MEKLRDSVQPYAMQLKSRFGKAAQILRSSSVREMQELSIEIPYEGQLLSFSHEPFFVVSWPHALFKMSPLKEPSPMSLLSFEGNSGLAVENLKRSKAVMCARLVLKDTQIFNCARSTVWRQPATRSCSGEPA